MSEPKTITPGLSEIAAGIWRVRLGEPEAITPVSVRQSVPRVAELPAVGRPPFDWEQIEFRTAARGCVVTLPLGRDEGLYGLGLQLKSHLQTGKKKTLRTNSDPIADTGDSHAPVPFYVSTAGYGVLVDTCRYASFYLGTHSGVDQWEARAQEKQRAIAEGTEDLYKLRAISGRVVVDIPVARGVDIYLFAGPTLGQAVQRYNLFSGGGCLPPLWGLGGWYRCHGKSTAAEVVALAERLRRDQLPFDVLGLEPGWHSHSYPCSFRWSAERFSDPDALIASTRALGYRLNLWEHAFVHPAAPIAAALRPHCGTEMAFDGLVPDLLTPEAQRIFAEHHEQTLIARGVAGFKLDECDHSDFIGYAWSFPEWTQFPSGADGEQMHSLFGIRYQHLMDSAFRRQGRRHYSEVRASHALAAGLPYVLYSDLYDFRDFLRGLVNCGFSGLLWCPEVRHAVSADDLVRRMQAVVLSPQALVNAWYIQNPPWEDAAATDLIRQALQLRMRLLPYLYTAFARYWQTGRPPFRALVMDYPADHAVREIDDQYLIGDALLAALVAPGQSERTVYLPCGGWYDFHTGQRHEGGQRLTVPAPLAHIPLFVREGTVLPLATPVQHVNAATVFQITPTVFGQGEATGMLFEDDGETFAYETGECAWIQLRWTRTAAPEITRSKELPFRRYEFRQWR
ncbi:MAG: hypothetical protein PCFJNLEI_03003 [Verrucomicrobiae bacterium]|nr:hypothetical protein [Verrucomicrobiae bacterium]